MAGVPCCLKSGGPKTADQYRLAANSGLVLANFSNWGYSMWLFNRPKTFTLNIYMKSGNVIRLDGIKEYEIKNQGDDIVGFQIEWHKPNQRLLVKTLDLRQIEAVTVT
jgi:hypothetical protein